MDVVLANLSFSCKMPRCSRLHQLSNPLCCHPKCNAPCIIIHLPLSSMTARAPENYHFFDAIAKSYPHCVAKIFLPEDYSPIILLGMIQDNAQSITTDLSVAFQFYLPYLTKDGSPTSFVIATRPKVSVNLILGLPLITATGMITTTQSTAEAKHLNCPPFTMDFCRNTKKPAIDASVTTHLGWEIRS
jgi:hypothetical protein